VRNTGGAARQELDRLPTIRREATSSWRVAGMVAGRCAAVTVALHSDRFFLTFGVLAQTRRARMFSRRRRQGVA
jgi:hypothetical protein